VCENRKSFLLHIIASIPVDLLYVMHVNMDNSQSLFSAPQILRLLRLFRVIEVPIQLKVNTRTYTLHIIHHTLHILHHTSYIIHHISYIIHHTSYIMHHTLCIIHHTSHIIHHTSYIIQKLKARWHVKSHYVKYFQIFFLILLVSHWSALVFCVIAFKSPADDNWMDRIGIYDSDPATKVCVMCVCVMCDV